MKESNHQSIESNRFVHHNNQQDNLLRLTDYDEDAILRRFDGRKFANLQTSRSDGSICPERKSTADRPDLANKFLIFRHRQ
jgi:hypothetical protein